MNNPLICIRAVHFAATLTVAGVAFFTVFIAEPAFREGRDDAGVAAIVRLRLMWLGYIGLALAFASGAAWLLLNAQEMSDRPLAEVLSEGVLWTVLLRTVFGYDWLARFALGCLLSLAFAAFLSDRGLKSSVIKAGVVILAAAFVGTMAWAGHAAGGLGAESVFHPAADVLHLIAAAAWVGMLIPLALLLAAVRQDGASIAIARTATLRFSAFGIASVATLIATGLVNTWYLVGGVPALIGTDYGRLLLAKIALFLVMAAIALVNRLRFTPRLARDASTASARAALRQLRRNITIEVAVGAAVIGIVAVLGITPPALHQVTMHAHH